MTMMQGLPLTGVSDSVKAKKRGEACLSVCLSHVKAMYRLLATIYDGLENDNSYEDDSDEDVPLETGDSTRLSQMFSNRCYKLVTLITNPTNGPVEFPLSQIMTVLTRGLSISYPDVLSVPSRSDLATLLPCIHQCCMDVLSQLILCCGRDLLAYSHVILDLCLQTVVSTGKMDSDHKSRTRSSAYQALVLWVRTCGWGKYLSTHRKLLIQELMADTQPDADDRLAKKNESDVSKPEKREKKGKKRKKKRRGDSYLELEAMEDGEGKEGEEESRQERQGLVLWAFSVTQLAVENLPFSASQNLMSHLVKTATTVSRLSVRRPEPYSQRDARKGLYQALASCLLSPLDHNPNRNDAVSHYQLTNSTLDLLTRACHQEDSQIQTVCAEALSILKSSANLKGPVIRKVLEYDDTEMEDVSQLMREKDQMSDNIEDLRQKLMTSEMENEQQLRLVSSLREQITSLQTQISTVSQLSVSQDEGMNEEDEDNDDNNSDDNKDDGEKDEGDDEEEGSKALAQHTTNNSPSPGDKENGAASKLGLDRMVASTSKNMTNAAITTTTSVKSRDLNQDDNTSTPNKSSSNKTNIDDMLMDFVDAPPDS